MKLRVGIRDTDEDIYSRTETELIISQIKKNNKEAAFVKKIIDRLDKADNPDGLWAVDVAQAISDGIIDIGIVSVKELMEINNTYIWKKGVKLSAITKRRDARIVLITKKHRNTNKISHRKNNNNNKETILYTSSKDVEKKCQYIYADTRCIYEEGLTACIERLTAGECDGVLAQADELRMYKYNHNKEFIYDYIPTDIYIPKTGTAMSAVLTAKKQELEDIAGKVQDEMAAACIEMEGEVIHKLNSSGYIQEARAISSIEGNVFKIDACVYNHGRSLRMNRSGDIGDKDIIMQSLVSDMLSKM